MPEVITHHLDLWTSALRTKSSAGRGGNGKLEAYGIKKLRELILELAVRGKLVAQDPNDEPADFYLKRVAVEKKKLIEAKEILKPKKLPSIDGDDVPFQLPNGWQWAYVWDVAKLITSGSRDWAKYYSNAGAIFITMGNLSRGDYKLRLDSLRYVNPLADGEGSRTRLEAKDLLISITGDVGNLGLIPEGFGEAYINQHTCLLRFMPDCQGRYFPEFMRSPWAKYQFDAPQRGVKNSFRLGDVGEMLIPVPPLAEQHRIVAKVDELMILCDQLEQRQTDSLAAHQTLVETLLGTLTRPSSVRPEPVEGRASSVRTELRAPSLSRGRAVEARPSTGSGRTEFEEAWARIASHFDTLFTTESSIDQLKQTLLQLAVMGKLVPQDPNDEPASVVLSRVAKIQRTAREAETKIKKMSAGVDRQPIPFATPEGWTWTLIDEFCSVQGGIQKQPKRQPKFNHFPYLRVANVQRGFIDVDEMERFELEQGELEKWELKSGDILIVEGNGSEEEIGRCAIWHGEIEECVYQNHLIRVRPHLAGLEEFMSKFLNSPIGMEEMKRLAVTTSGLYNLSVGKIRVIAVPLPPIEEQHRIVAKVDELMALCDALKARLADAQTTQLHLADAIVEQAVA